MYKRYRGLVSSDSNEIMLNLEFRSLSLACPPRLGIFSIGDFNNIKRFMPDIRLRQLNFVILALNVTFITHI